MELALDLRNEEESSLQDEEDASIPCGGLNDLVFTGMFYDSAQE